MVTRTPQQTQAALRKAARLSGLSRNVIAAQKRNMKTFLDEAEGKEKAAVTREDMTKVGLDFKKSGDLTKYLNMQNKKGRKPTEDDFRTTIKAQDKPDVPLVSPAAKKDKPKTATRGSKVVVSGGRASGSTTKKEVKKEQPKSILGKVKERVTQKTDAKPLRDPKELLNLVGGATALTRAAPSIISYLARNKGKKVSQKVVDYVRKLKDKRKDTSIRTQSGSGKTIRLGGANLRQVQGPPTPGKTTGAATRKVTRTKNKKTNERKGIEGNTVIDSRTGRITESAKKADRKRRREQIKKQKEEVKKAVSKNKPKELSVQETLAKIPSLKKTPTKTDAGPKLTQVQKLFKKFKDNPTGINNAIAKLDISPAAKSKLRQEVQSYKPSLAERKKLGLKKGGLIKRSVGGRLRDIPAGNKGLPNLPTAVRNKMGFKKKGGIVRRSKGGFLGAGKALRGQGAVMRKKGGKIAR